MSARPSDLFQAFREDHAVLGRGLYEISEHLRVGDLQAAKACTERLDREAGPHIAFEERFFYPALQRLLGAAEAGRLYEDHKHGLSIIKSLAALPEGAALSENELKAMLQDLELMQAHVAECGELFGAMGRISIDEQKALNQELLALRKRGPRWTEVAAKPETKTKRE